MVEKVCNEETEYTRRDAGILCSHLHVESHPGVFVWRDGQI